MRKIVLLLCACCASQLACAMSDIGFSNENGGYWSYTPSGSGQGIFSFIQPIGVNNVQGGTSDDLVNGYLHLPDLLVSNLTQVYPGIYMGLLTPVSTTIALKDAGGADILTGTLASGGIFTIGSTATMYENPVGVEIDVVITNLPNAIESDFIDSLRTGWGFDLNLTLQDSANLANAILTNQTLAHGSSLSGSMTAVIPEPATMLLLGIGAAILRKRLR